MDKNLHELANTFVIWLQESILTWGSLIQLAWIVVILVLCNVLIARPLCKRLDTLAKRESITSLLRHILEFVQPIVWPFAAVFILSVSLGLTNYLGINDELFKIAINLLGAWFVIRIVSQFIRNELLANLFASAAFIVAALNFTGALGPITSALDNMSFKVGEFKLSILTLGQSILVLLLLLWLAQKLGKFLEMRLRHSRNLTPSVQVLLSKIFKILLIAVAIVVTLDSVGIDLTALAVLSGGIGVGIGFGLQKTVSNMLTGFILLMDKSIKPGDVIEVEDTFGWVTAIGGRCISIITRDGTEHLIPNEKMITETVINWSHSNDLLRVEVKLGVHYQSDVEKARQLCIEAGRENSRVVKEPDPVCHIRGFGDSSVDLDLLVWIRDPREGIRNLRGELYLAIWRKFHENNIEIPYPQRDIHVRTIPEEWKKTIEKNSRDS